MYIKNKMQPTQQVIKTVIVVKGGIIRRIDRFLIYFVRKNGNDLFSYCWHWVFE